MANDYRKKDGLLYCGVCGQPKERKNIVFGIESIVHTLCECEAKELEERERTWEEEQRMIRIDNLRVDGIQDRERRKCLFENADRTPEIIKCMQYVDNWREMKSVNAGLLMWGPCGNGKSFSAACIANALIAKNVPVLMTSLPTILGDPNNIMEVVRQMKEYELVIIDDLGAERQSQYALEKTFFVIDERYKVGKPLIVTTNQRLEDMKAAQKSGDADHKRIYDRILEMCTPIMFSEESRRGASQKAKREVLKRVFA